MRRIAGERGNNIFGGASLAPTVALAALLLVGCGGRAMSSWQGVNQDRQRYAGKLGFTADMPVGWMMYEDRQEKALLLTRFGVPMDVVRIKRHTLPAALPHTELSINAHAQIYELAQTVINNLRVTPGVRDLAIEELAPQTVGGHDGFRALGSYSLENGIRRRCLIYGAIHGGKYYTEIGLYALDDYYFGMVIDDFIKLAESFVP